MINNSSANNFKTAIDSVFEVDAYLKVLATEVLIGHWDNYFFNKNNYYLYHQASGKFIYLPYDMDNTFGVQYGVSNIDKRDVNAWGRTFSEAPLTFKIMDVPEYKAKYETYINQFCNSAFSENRLFTLMDSLKTMLAPAVNVDPFFTGAVKSDYGYTVSQWQRSFTEKIDNHASFGLKPYVTNRRTSALQQTSTVTGISNIEAIDAEVYPNPASDRLNIHSAGSTPIHVAILDLSGKLVFEKDFQAEEQSISVKQFPKGIYMLNLISGKGQKHMKVFIEH